MKYQLDVTVACGSQTVTCFLEMFVTPIGRERSSRLATAEDVATWLKVCRCSKIFDIPLSHTKARPLGLYQSPFEMCHISGQSYYTIPCPISN